MNLGSEKLQNILARVSTVDGPVRLLAPRTGERCEGVWLFRDSRGSKGRVIGELTHSLLSELPREGNGPRRVKLSVEGMGVLLALTPEAEKPELVRRASPLYQREMLLAWKEASPARSPELEESLAEFCEGLMEGLGGTAESLGCLEPFRGQLATVLLRASQELDTEVEAVEEMLGMLGFAKTHLRYQKDRFSPSLHMATPGLAEHTPVVVVAPGWLRDQRVVRKAVVKPLER